MFNLEHRNHKVESVTDKDSPPNNEQHKVLPKHNHNVQQIRTVPNFTIQKKTSVVVFYIKPPNLYNPFSPTAAVMLYSPAEKSQQHQLEFTNSQHALKGSITPIRV